MQVPQFVLVAAVVRDTAVLSCDGRGSLHGNLLHTQCCLFMITVVNLPFRGCRLPLL